MTQGGGNGVPANTQDDGGSKESLVSTDYIDAMNNTIAASDKPLLSTNGDDDDSDGGELGSSDYIEAAKKDSVFSSPKGETYVPPPNQ